MTTSRRQVLTAGLLAGCALGAGSALGGGPAAAAKVLALPACGLDLSHAAIAAPADWDRAYEARWGPLGRQSLSQIHGVVHADNGVYDDRDAVFAWVVHHWIRAWLAMAKVTGSPKYMDSCVSFIDYMLDHTDERRIARGEIAEDYVEEPLYLRGTGRGGPFWKQSRTAGVLQTGQIARAILYFVDAVFAAPVRWSAYHSSAERYFAEAIAAVDAFDNDWQKYEDKGSYHYRDSEGSGQLGTTRTAFNQSATMAAAQLLIDTWRPDATRRDKVRRLAQYWIEDYAVAEPDGAIGWRYMLGPVDPSIEDAGHAGIDLDFLVPAYLSGATNLAETHMNGLTRTFMHRVWDGGSGLNQFVDGASTPDYSDFFNAGFGWLRLARFEPKIAPAALRVYNAHYRPEGSDHGLWSQPMLGWANLLLAAQRCDR